MSDQYMTIWGQAFDAANDERAYASGLQDAAQEAWQNVMNAGEHFEGGYDEAVMTAQASRKMVDSHAEGHIGRAGATDDSGHIAMDTVSRVSGLWGGGI